MFLLNSLVASCYIGSYFYGKWGVASLYSFVRKQGWTLFERYGHNRFIWEFENIRKLEFPTGTVAYKGRKNILYIVLKRKPNTLIIRQAGSYILTVRITSRLDL